MTKKNEDYILDTAGIIMKMSHRSYIPKKNVVSDDAFIKSVIQGEDFQKDKIACDSDINTHNVNDSKTYKIYHLSYLWFHSFEKCIYCKSS